MPKNSAIELEGVVIEALGNGRYRIQLDNGHVILGHVAGKLRLHYIRILPGDKVKVAMTPYDLSQGRITYRYNVEKK